MTPKLIEEKFPVKEISRLAIPERSSYRPIYQISKWFARRSSSIFRAIILGSTIPRTENLMEQFYKKHDLNGIVLLDPFVGGGTTCIEGLRLGLRCVGCDINPIAWFITKTEAEPINIKTLEKAITKCENELQSKIKGMYQTICPYCRNEEADVIYVHWVRIVPCEHCGEGVRLFRNYVVGKVLDHHYLLCPECLTVFKSKDIPASAICPSCNNKFDPRNGNRVGRTKIRCSGCKKVFLTKNSRKSLKRPLKAEMFAVEGFCHKCTVERKNRVVTGRRFFKGVDGRDLELFNKSKEEWYARSTNLPSPKERIPDGHATQILKNHHYFYWYELFNERQLLALSMILDYIVKIKSQQVQEMLLAAFINLLNHNNVFTRYSAGGQKVEGIFARHDYHPLSSYAENNVWGTKYGRGTWVKCLKRLIEGKKYNLNPYSYRYKDNKRIKVFSGQIEGRITTNPDEFRDSTEKNLLLLCRDSSEIPPTIGQLDLIITDPPYADNVNYSELSDFFYVWIRIALKNRYPWFNEIETPKRNEAIVSRKRKFNFYKKLVDIFKHTKSLLKDEGLFIFTFHHSNKQVWRQMSKVLLESGLKVIKTYALPSEARNVLNIHNKKAISFDLIIVSKKDNLMSGPEIKMEQFLRKLNYLYDIKMKELEKAGIKTQGYDHLAVFFGCLLEIESNYEVINEERGKCSHEELWDLAINMLP